MQNKHTQKNCKLSIIIPVYNEEANLLLLYDQLVAVIKRLDISTEMLFINDGSRDASLEKIVQLSKQDERIKYINFSRNFGHQIALTAGFDHVIGERIVVIDADMQDPPSLIYDLYKKMDEGFEVVYAKRKKRLGESRFRLWITGLFYRMLAKISTIQIPLDTGDYRIVSRKIVDLLHQMPEQSKYYRGQIAWLGFRQTYVEFERQERNAGESGYSYINLIKLALNGITGFTDFPLRIVSISGFFVSGVAFIVLFYALITRLISDKIIIEGWASTIVSVLFIGGIQLIGIGIIGEYISRINQNTRTRPLYIIEDSNINHGAAIRK